MMEKVTEKSKIFVGVTVFSSLQALAYHTAKRKTKGKVREVAIIAVIVDGRDEIGGGRTHSLGGEGGGGRGVNILEDAKHSSVLCICKYFVGRMEPFRKREILY
jgi:hypothetical protein